MERIWQVIAWLGRYGNQPALHCLSMPVSYLNHLANGVSRIMRDEAESMRGSSDA